MNSLHVDCKDYKIRWKIDESLVGGGQGDAFVAISRDSGQRVFLKLLKNQKDPERRARFAREAVAYETYRHAALPTLIESNTHLYSDLEAKLYIATELVPGPTLSKFIEERGPLEIEKARESVSALLDVVGYLHRNSCVHRDIKPDNIILREGSYAAPVLVDFGLSYSQKDNDIFKTEDGQELGNRFLRLPELSSGSLDKQDPCSDITFVGGIYFYMLTGHMPAMLLDGNGAMPHQRTIASDMKGKHAEVLPALSRVFDKVFQYRSADRYANSDQLLDAIARIELYCPASDDDPDDILREIMEGLDTEHHKRTSQRRANLERAMDIVRDIVNRMAGQIGDFTTIQSNYTAAQEKIHNEIGFCSKSDGNVRFMPHLDASLVGDELIVVLNQEEILRTSADHPSFRDEFVRRARLIYAKGAQGLQVR